jgi:Cu2+-exporting ATPase
VNKCKNVTLFRDDISAKEARGMKVMEHKGHEHHVKEGVHAGHKMRDHAAHHKRMMEDFKKRFIISMILTVPILMLAPMVRSFLGLEYLSFPGDFYVLFALSAVVYVYGGKPFLKGTKDEILLRKPGMMTLIGIAISVAFFYSAATVFILPGEGFFWELATLVDIMLLGHWIEMRSVLGASRALEELARLMPTEAHVIKNGEIVDVPIDKLEPHTIVLVKPGEKVPADGFILEGETSINEAMLTGESKPIYKKPGDPVIGGSINLEGAVKVHIHKTGRDTYLSQLIELVQQAQESKSKTQDLANKAAFWLTLIAIFAGSLTLTVWLLSGEGFAFSIERMVTVMVIACPHALGLAIPLVVAVSTSISATRGVLVRNREAFERAKDVNVVVFDKTGTLTEGKFGVTDIVPLSNMKEDKILAFAASLESQSEHPIAQGIVEAAKERGINLFAVSDFKVLPGRGAEALVNGKKVLISSPQHLKEVGLWNENKAVKEVLKQGKTVVFLVVDGKLKGAIALADKVREESKEAIRALKKFGIKSVMLTGDNRAVAEWVSKELGLDGYFAEVLPHQKVEKIKELKEQGNIVSMVGDGINDAPALVEADVGIAIGAGTDVAIESADIILVKNDPRDVVDAIKIARSTYKKMVQNLLWATGYNAFAIPAAAGVLYPSLGILLTPAIGAIFMSLSTVIVAINARLLKVK